MCVHACVCAYVCVRMCVCISACMCVCGYVYTCLCVCMNVCAYTHAHVCDIMAYIVSKQIFIANNIQKPENFFIFCYLQTDFIMLMGVRCSTVVRAFAHGAMGCRIDPSWSGPIDFFSRSSQCSTTGVTKVVVCPILSVGWCI